MWKYQSLMRHLTGQHAENDINRRSLTPSSTAQAQHLRLSRIKKKEEKQKEMKGIIIPPKQRFQTGNCLPCGMVPRASLPEHTIYASDRCV